MLRVRRAAATLIVLLLALAPGASASALGGASPGGPTGLLPDPATQGLTTGVQHVEEMPALRSEYSDTFLQADGSRLLKIANHPINYQVGGTWQPIEDQLVEDAGGWRPAASPVPVSLPRTLGAAPIAIGAAGHQVSFQLRGASASSGKPVGSEGTYHDALPGVDASYAATGAGVRETLTLASASVPSEYQYALGLSAGMRANLNPGGSVTIRDSQGNVAYTVAAPSANDASTGLASTGAVRYELSPDGATLTLVVDKSWITDPARRFPVTIDPDVYFGAIKDCQITSGTYENSELCGGRLYVGHSNESSITGRALIQFNLSSVPRGSQVLSSSLALWLKSAPAGANQEIDAYGLSKEFTSKATWQTYDGTHAWTTAGGDHLKPLAGTSLVKPEYAGGWISIGFSPQVEQWVRDPTSDFGILLKAHNESANLTDEFVQTANGKGEPEPNLNIVYEPQLGNPPNEAMFQQPIGNGGTLAVNVANGNLHVTNPDVNYATEGYNTQLARSYNSDDDEHATSSLGAGWRLNMGGDTLLYPAWWDGSNAFHEPDGSYTRFDRAAWADNHPSAGDKAYTGDAYRPETLTTHEDGTRTLTYNDTGIEWQFDKSTNGYPQKIVNKGGEGNTISLSYTESLLTKVTDTHAHALSLTRESTGTRKVTKIKGAGAGETWTYTYNSEGLLTKFKGPGGQEAKYTYTGPYHELESIADPSGTNVITYDSSNRVSGLRHIVNGTVKTVGSEDEITTFSYETEQTTVTHPTGTTSLYYYDEFGNVLEEPATQTAASEFYAGYAGIEAEAARKAVDLEDHASILDSQLTSQLGADYTGEWLDPSSGKIKIGITSEGYEQTAEQDLDNLGLADNIELVTAASSWTSLQAASEKVKNNLATLIEEHLVAIQVAISENAVKLVKSTSLTSAQNTVVSEARAKAGATTVVEEVPAENLVVHEFACEHALCGPPLRGGVDIESQGSPRFQCTAGFNAVRPGTAKKYIVTAGHCLKDAGGEGVTWASAFPSDSELRTRKLGPARTAVQNEQDDAGIIEVLPSSPFIEVPGSSFAVIPGPTIIVYGNGTVGTKTSEEYPILGTHFDPEFGPSRQEQFTVCMGGAIGGFLKSEVHSIERCGQTEGLFSNLVKGAPEYELAYVCTPLVTSGLQGGTSGAPVYKANRAYGIVRGGVGAHNCLTIFDGINKATHALNVTLLTG